MTDRLPSTTSARRSETSARRLSIASAALAVLAPLAQSASVARASEPKPALLATDSEATPSTSSARAFLELSSERDAYFVHEVIRLRFVVGVEERFWKENLVQPFQQALDVPVQIVTPWRDAPEGLVALAGRAPLDASGVRSTVAWNEGVFGATRGADRVTDGVRFAVFEIAIECTAPRPGDISIPPAALRLAYATRFADDVFQGRVAVDRQDAVEASRPLTLAIAPLPEDGRPIEFTGAVGRFRIGADVSPRAIELGQSVTLALRIEGDGDLEHFDAPRFEELALFRIQGVIDEKRGTERVLRYDLAPRSADVAAVPSVEFHFFDPTPPGRYTSIRSAAIPIEVKAAVDGASSSAPRASTRPPPVRSLTARVVEVLLVVAGALALAVGIRAVVRRRRHTPS